MGDACRVLGTPVTGGNVSFYNESPEGAVYPTPTIGMIGLIEDISNVVSSDFKEEGDAILLLSVPASGNPYDGLGGSEYLVQRTGKVTGQAPECNIESEAALIKALVELAEAKLLRSAHDVSDGGLAVALAESCFAQATLGQRGARVKLPSTGRRDVALFADRQGQVVLSAKQVNVAGIQAIATKHGLQATVIGEVGGSSLTIEGMLEEPVASLWEIYSGAIATALGEVEVA
jgi:phosphoribosylformylglycinamidine synthase